MSNIYPACEMKTADMRPIYFYTGACLCTRAEGVSNILLFLVTTHYSCMSTDALMCTVDVGGGGFWGGGRSSPLPLEAACTHTSVYYSPVSLRSALLFLSPAPSSH